MSDKEKLQREIDLHCDFNNYLLEKIEKAGKEIERLNNIIKEAKEFIERYLQLDLDEFNCNSLLNKLNEIITRGDEK